MDKKIKRRMVDYAAYDYPYIQRLLTEQAARGWRFTGLNQGLWEFERSEPAHIRYEVTYAPTESGFNPGPTEQEQTLEELCARVGWVKVASFAKMHIYCNEDPNAVPIETDEGVRLATIEKSMKKLVPQRLLGIGLGILLLILIVMTGFQNILTTLATPGYLFALLWPVWLIADNALNLAAWLLWRHRARRAAASRQNCPESTFYRRYRYSYWGMLALCACAMLRSGHALYSLAMMGCIIVGWLVGLEANKDLKASGHSAKSNRAWTMGACLVTALLLWLLVSLGMELFGLAARSDDEYQVEEIPLMCQDLKDTGDTEYVLFHTNIRHSFLASSDDYWQAAEGAFGLDLDYTIYDIRIPLFRDICLDAFTEDFQRVTAARYTELDADPALWGAQQVRHSTNSTGDQWLIVYEDRIVWLFADWHLTREQIAVAADKLSP